MPECSPIEFLLDHPNEMDMRRLRRTLVIAMIVNILILLLNITYFFFNPSIIQCLQLSSKAMLFFVVATTTIKLIIILCYRLIGKDVGEGSFWSKKQIKFMPHFTMFLQYVIWSCSLILGGVVIVHIGCLSFEFKILIGVLTVSDNLNWIAMHLLYDLGEIPRSEFHRNYRI